ncbi:MAG: transposase [Pirellulales bacterium]
MHPSVLCKVLLFAMIRIRSSRQIEYELRHAIDFANAGSQAAEEIDHATLSEFRRKHAGSACRRAFNQ